MTEGNWTKTPTEERNGHELDHENVWATIAICEADDSGLKVNLEFPNDGSVPPASVILEAIACTYDSKLLFLRFALKAFFMSFRNEN